jgi:muramoyltetrapeptide carboxypeptidase
MPQTLKPEALRPADAVRILSLASPVDPPRLQRGIEEIARLGYTPKLDVERVLARGDFFAGSAPDRGAALKEALTETSTRGIFCSRGGYGSNYLLDGLSVALANPKVLVGYSDLTSLQIFLWQKFRWITIYGPMAAAGLDKGANVDDGYDSESLTRALTETKTGWTIPLAGTEAIMPGSADGILLGGCLTLIETALGTPWELDTHGAILLLEDRGMKPWQVDRALMHLKQAGKLRGVSGVLLGEFPECHGPAGTESVLAVARRILGTMGFPVVWGAAVGHTPQPMLTLPLGVRARLRADDTSRLEILEPACRA